MNNNKNTGMGSDIFFKSAPAAATSDPAKKKLTEDKPERRSYNLRPSILKLLDETQFKTAQRGEKMSLSAIVELGIELAAAKIAEE